MPTRHRVLRLFNHGIRLHDAEYVLDTHNYLPVSTMRFPTSFFFTFFVAMSTEDAIIDLTPEQNEIIVRMGRVFYYNTAQDSVGLILYGT